MATNFRNQIQKLRQTGGPVATQSAEAFDLIQPELDSLDDQVATAQSDINALPDDRSVTQNGIAVKQPPDVQNAAQSTADFKGDHLSIRMFGALPGARVFDASITAGGHQIDSVNAHFTPGVVNQWAYVAGAGAAGAGFASRIIRYVSPTQVLVANNASTSVTNAELRYGPDNTRAINAGILYISATRVNGGRLLVPKGIYLTTATVNVPSNVRLEGEAYTSDSKLDGGPTEPQSFVCCINAVPAFTITAAAVAPSFAKLGISGTPDSGSKGIYGSNASEATVEDCFFECFGDHALHIAAGTGGSFRRNYALNAMLHRTRAQFDGVFDIAATGAVITGNDTSASFADVSGVVSGAIASLAVRGPHSFVSENIGQRSEVGIYASPDCIDSVFVDNLAGLNQAQGWAVQGDRNSFIGNRAHANSLAADGTYDAYTISGAGNYFSLNRVTWNGAGAGPTHFRVASGFTTQNAAASEANVFDGNYLEAGSYTGLDFNFGGTNKIQPLLDLTASFAGLPDRPIVRSRGDLVVQEKPDGTGGVSWIRDGGAGANAKNWAERVNNPANLNELLFSLFSDDLATETTWLLVRRAGTTVALIKLFGNVDIDGDLLVEGDLEVQGAAKFDSTVEVDSLTPGQLVATNGGDVLVSQPGLTTSQVVIESLNIFQDTIDYAPGASSFTAVIAITNNTKTLDFTIGALTGDS